MSKGLYYETQAEPYQFYRQSRRPVITFTPEMTNFKECMFNSAWFWQRFGSDECKSELRNSHDPPLEGVAWPLENKRCTNEEADASEHCDFQYECVLAGYGRDYFSEHPVWRKCSATALTMAHAGSHRVKCQPGFVPNLLDDADLDRDQEIKCQRREEVEAQAAARARRSRRARNVVPELGSHSRTFMPVQHTINQVEVGVASSHSCIDYVGTPGIQ